MWQVGYFDAPRSDGFRDFCVLREFGTADEAAAYLNYLNGGTGKIKWRSR
jgi:hypothetical protein